MTQNLSDQIHLQSYRPAGWKFWLLWTAVTALGFLAMIPLGFLFLPILVFGAVIGLLQWMVLKQYLPITKSWIWASFWGWVLTIAVSILLFLTFISFIENDLFPPDLIQILNTSILLVFVFPFISFFTLFGLLTGFLQARHLRRLVSQSGLWVAANALGYAGLGLAFSALAYLADQFTSDAGIWLALVGIIPILLIPGGITGAAMAQLINNQLKETKIPAAEEYRPPPITTFKNRDFSGQNLSGGNFNGADFSGANLRGTNLRGASFEPVVAWKKAGGIALSIALDENTLKELRTANFCGADLTAAILENARMCRADLEDAILVDANLKNALLPQTNFMYADLRGADLSHADLNHALLCHANLEGANLQFANLDEADLEGANLNNAILTGVDLTSADIQGATFENVDLSDTLMRTELKLNFPEETEG